MADSTEPTDAKQNGYWRSVYNRLERGVGWICLSVGAILLLCYGAFKLIEEMIRSPSVAVVVKVGVVGLILGVIILVVSVVRERLVLRKKDKYSEEVER